MIMKKVALLLACSVLLVGGASAYIITLSAPKTIYVGETLNVNGTSTLPAGYSTELTLTKVGSSKILSQKQIIIQGDGSFSLSFNTSTLEGGTYRLEVPYNST